MSLVHDYVLTAADVKRQDAGCEARGIPTERLMESAGWGVARAARDLLGGTYGRRVVIVCGKGNNAGDGLVSGRHLAAMGAHVTAVLAAGDGFTGAAAVNYERFRKIGRTVGLEQIGRELDRADLAIDALLGVGLSRPPEGGIAEAIEAMFVPLPVLAVDVPSGVDSDTGRILGRARPATATVTLGGMKPGLLFEPGRTHAGDVLVHDIGVPEDLRAGAARLISPADPLFFEPLRAGDSHKRSVGTVLAVLGSRGLPGAAALTAGAAVHSGAGLTVLAAPESVCRLVISRVPEITAVPLPENEEGTIDAKSLELIRPRLEGADAVVIGPGLSVHPAALEAVRALIPDVEVPLIVDADAITAVQDAQELLTAREAPTVLTPHAGELSRLLRRPAAELDAGRLAAAAAAAEATNATVVFKGPGTVIASPGEPPWINPSGSEALAQGGTGDVLAGMVASLAAQAWREDEFDDATVASAVWLHGTAGDLIAERVGPHPANAAALIEALPALFHEVYG